MNKKSYCTPKIKVVEKHIESLILAGTTTPVTPPGDHGGEHDEEGGVDAKVNNYNYGSARKALWDD